MDLDVFNKSSLRGHVNAYEMKESESQKHISLLELVSKIQHSEFGDGVRMCSISLLNHVGAT